MLRDIGVAPFSVQIYFSPAFSTPPRRHADARHSHAYMPYAVDAIVLAGAFPLICSHVRQRH